MMINKRLLGWVKETKKYIAINVFMQWIALLANIIIVYEISSFLVTLPLGTVNEKIILKTFMIIAMAMIIRFVCTITWNNMSYECSAVVKKKLRHHIYDKLLSLGSGYVDKIATSEVVQVAVEGVEQLETYFASYLPQFFYSVIAPMTLFILMCFINVPSAIVLFVCVPLIPISIALVQTFAKKLLARYWNQYAGLGDTFLENLQGLVTLKIYKADEYKSKVMDEEAEKFRKITMKVLIMQLNSISIMDLVAYGGAALGIIVGVMQYGRGNVNLLGCLMIILLSAEFFLPMRLLGSYFHIAMNGMAASDKIFKIMDMGNGNKGTVDFPKEYDGISIEHVNFAYEEQKEILKEIKMYIEKGKFIGIVGESGCGKSTLASVLMGRNKNYGGKIKIASVELSHITEESLMKNITYIGHQSYLFKGTVRENLAMACKTVGEKEMWQALRTVNMESFLKEQQGLDTVILENASNLSGGQCQRLSLARGILHKSPIYIFDEATSNIDVDSEDTILQAIKKLAEDHTVIFISHRLFNIIHADEIYVMSKGRVVGHGSHEELLKSDVTYKEMWHTQQNLEMYRKEEA